MQQTASSLSPKGQNNASPHPQTHKIRRKQITTFPTSNPANEHNKTPAKTRRRTPIMDRIVALTDFNGPIHPEGPHKGRCHDFMGSRSASGTQYGMIHTTDPITGRSRMKSVHRVAYENHHGVTLSPDVLVLHTCDRQQCCNPEHLEIGNHAENMRQKAERGRASAPRKRHSALKGQQILEMRAKGATHKEIMDTHNVSPTWLKGFLKRQEQPAPLPLFDGPAVLN
ncbi:HNH endonuclease [Gluconobacter kondonii]|uniref:HNH endonuclease n=1 Tax=Gluconobacter kondonii TaxID=941463 RepID=UPI001B8C60B8|nr:HNH endonuclease [Gluconobacter kondonii]MBS1084596.1 HNH endonuclease [Gluconobacter kondonii]